MNQHTRNATLLSILFMGLGHIYNKRIVKGIIFAVIELFFIIVVLPMEIKNIRGLITLGDIPQRMIKGKIVQGDHSVFMLIYGIVAIIIAFIFIILYLINISDARNGGKLRDKGRNSKNIEGDVFSALDKRFPYILLTPAVVFTLFLTVLPLLFGILIAFTDYSSPNHIPPRALVNWVGLQNFINLFKISSLKTTFLGVLSWTIIWAIIATLTTFFVGLIFAVIINSSAVKIKKFWRTIYIIPWAMPSFISVLMMRNMFNGEFGPINKYLSALGVPAIGWFSDPTWAKITCVLVNIWFGFPYYMALMSGILSGISKDMYEAAEIEGASPFQQFRNITLPMVMFATAPLLIMAFSFNFNNFNLIYLLTNGNPVNPDYTYAGATDILLSWLYKLTLEQSQFQLASVVSILIFLVVATISAINFLNTRAFKEEDMIQ
ncbi:MAG: sugar ABC transporter permease [Clostridia bacterium]|nr:sugar ABC transporter permease [Clostridia bacterium]